MLPACSVPVVLLRQEQSMLHLEGGEEVRGSPSSVSTLPVLENTVCLFCFLLPP